MKTIAAVLLGFCGLAWGEAIVLNDGRRFEGDLKREGAEWVLTDSAGRVLRFSPSEVKTIELGRQADDPAAPKQRLEFLKRYTETLSDPAVAIARYEQFLKQFPGSDQEPGARKELDTWRQRRDQGMVKVGAKWLSGDELAKWEEANATALEAIRQLVRHGRLKDADTALDPLLAADPANAGALYLQGVVQYKLEQVAPARKSFEGVLASIPDHPATLNNMAVISWRQKQEAAAVSLLDRAASNMSGNQQILDNIAEVLNGISRDTRNSNTAKRLAKRYDEQEPQLEQAMLKQGFYRWGSAWVTKAQYDDLQRVQKEIAGQLDTLAREYDATETAIARLTQDIEANQRTMRRIEADSLRRDEFGNVVRLAYPSSYYDMQRETERMNSRRRGEIDRLASLRTDAEKVRSRLAVPPYSGSLKIMDEAYTPLVLHKQPPTTAPAK